MNPRPTSAASRRTTRRGALIGVVAALAPATLLLAQEGPSQEARYPGDTAFAIQCLTISLAVALVCLCATVLACRSAGMSRRSAVPAMGVASVISIALTWWIYAEFMNSWPILRAWAIVGIPAQAVGHALVSWVLLRTVLPEAERVTPLPGERLGPRTNPALNAAAPVATSDFAAPAPNGPNPQASPAPGAPPDAPPVAPPGAAPGPAPDFVPRAAPATARDGAIGPSPTEAPAASARRPTVFISYRRADSSDVTGRIHDRLAASLGSEHVFTDVDSIPLGVDFRDHVSGILARTDCMLAIIGRDWLSIADAAGKRRLDDPADLVRIEIETALARGVPVIPLLVQGARMPVETELPESLRGLAFRNGMSVRPNPDFHRDVDRLERQLLGQAQGKAG